MQSDSTFEWYGDEFLNDFKVALVAGFDAAGSTLVGKIKRRFKTGTDQPPEPAGGTPRNMRGDLARSIGRGEATEDGVDVGIVEDGGTLKYATIQEFGGTIVPKTKKMLAWVTNGKRRNDPQAEWARAKKVVIPPRPFMRPGAEENAELVGKVFANRVESSLRESGEGR